MRREAKLMLLAGAGVAAVAAVAVALLVVPECGKASDEGVAVVDPELPPGPEPTPGPPGPTRPQHDAGAPLPPADARQSGLPYDDPSLPVGRVQIRVVRGMTGAGTPAADLPLHWVTMHMDGRTELGKQVTAADGTVQIDGLKTDGTAAYYALAALDGDRLETFPLVPGPRAGIRVILRARPAGSPAPPVDGMVPGDPVNAREVIASVAHGNDPTIDVLLLDLDSGAARPPTEQIDDPQQGRVARWRDLDDGGIYAVRAKVRGKTYLSLPLLTLNQRGVSRRFWAVDRPFVECRYHADVEKGSLPFTVQLGGGMSCNVAQSTGAPQPPEPGGLRMLAPAGATAFELYGDNGPARRDGNAIVWTRPMPPGGIDVRATFHLPVQGTQADVTIPASLSMYSVRVAVGRGPRTRIEMISDAAVREHTSPEDGRSFHFIDAQYGKVNPSAPLRFRIVGLDPPGPCEQLGAVLWRGRGGSQPAPDIRAPDRDGKQHRLADLRGKVVVLNLWATWCPPCTEELPSLAALQRRYAKDVVVVALSNDKSWADAGPLATRNPGPLYLLDPPASADSNIGPITIDLGTRALPETYLIDRDGNIRHWIVNLREWDSPEAHACIDTLVR